MDNKGLSLIEVIIVICIMTVFVGIVSVGVGSVMTKPADECAEKLVSSINNARVSAMGKMNYELIIKQDGDKAEIFIEVNGKSTRIGKKGIEVTCTKAKKDGTSASSFYLNSAQKVTLSFDRSTGGFKPVKIGDSSVDPDYYLTQIVVTMGSRSSTIKLVPITGKVKIE